MSHEPGGPKSNRQEPGGSTSDYLTLVPKETCQKSNHQEPVGSTYEGLTLVPKNICYVHTQNKILAPYIINTYETDRM